MNNTPGASEALQLVPFFSRLSPDEASILADELIMRKFSAGQIVFHMGDPGGLLYIITKGKVKISHSNPDGQEALLAILGPSDHFGELALLDDAPRSATAEAIEPAEMLTLHRDVFTRFLNHNPPFAHHVLATLSSRIRHLNSQISDIFFLDLPGRLASTILYLADKHGVETDEGIRIDLSLTQTDLAEMTGATRVSINKALGRFRRAGWVVVEGRYFTVVDREALENIINPQPG